MRRKRGFIFLSRCCRDSLAFCAGTESGAAEKIWSLHLASYWLHIRAIIENTIINYLFQWFFFFFLMFWAGQLRLKIMFQVPSGTLLQLVHSWAWGVSWWKTKSLWLCRAAENVLFSAFPGRELCTTKQRACKPDSEIWLTGWQRATLWFREDRGHLTSLGCSALLTTASVY